jgi:hypothetical protein
MSFKRPPRGGGGTSCRFLGSSGFAPNPRSEAAKGKCQKRLERVEAKRRTGGDSQAEAIQLIDKRHSYATRRMTVADRAILNVLILGRELNVVQPKK